MKFRSTTEDPPPSELDNGNLAVMYNTKQKIE